MRRSRAFFAITVATAAVATSAEAATVGAPGGPSVQVPQVQVPRLSPAPSLPKAQAPTVGVPAVKLPSLPSGGRALARRPGGAVPAGGATAGGNGSGASGSGKAGSSAPGGSSGSLRSSSSTGGVARVASPSAAGRPLSARQRRAREARKQRALRRDVRRLRGCLDAVSPFERQVLVLRAGLAGRAHSRSEVARVLDTSAPRVHRGERSGVQGLREAARSTGCGGRAPTSSVDPVALAVGTNEAAPLRPVNTMAGPIDALRTEVPVRSTRQVLGASAGSDGSSSRGGGEDEPRAILSTGARLSAGEDGTALSPPLVLLLLLVLAVTLGLVALRYRHGGATAGVPAPAVSATPAAVEPAARSGEPEAEHEAQVAPASPAQPRPGASQEAERAFRPGDFTGWLSPGQTGVSRPSEPPPSAARADVSRPSEPPVLPAPHPRSARAPDSGATPPRSREPSRRQRRAFVLASLAAGRLLSRRLGAGRR